MNYLEFVRRQIIYAQQFIIIGACKIWLIISLIAHVLVNVCDARVNTTVKVDFSVWLLKLQVFFAHLVVSTVNFYGVGKSIVFGSESYVFHFNFLSKHSIDCDRDNFGLKHPSLLGKLGQLLASQFACSKVDLLFHVLSISPCYTLVNSQLQRLADLTGKTPVLQDITG